MRGRNRVGWAFVAIAAIGGVVSPVGAADTREGRVTEFSAGITANAGLSGITAGPDGNVWFTEQEGNRIGRITPKGKVTEFSAGITANAVLSGITAGPDGNLWFTETGASGFQEGQEDRPGRIGRITPKGKVTEFSAGLTTRSPKCPLDPITGVGTGDDCGFTEAASPEAITPGPDGNLWFTERYAGRIGRITPDGAVTEFSTGISLVGEIAFPPWLGAIAAGPDGNLWFATRNTIGRITPAGVVTEFSTGIKHSNDVDFSLDITEGPDGNLWFTEEDAPQIGRITPAGVVTHFSTGRNTPGAMTAGPDGNLWGAGGNRIVRITTGGVATRFSAGITANAGVNEITVGCDGNLWFTEIIGNRIGRFEFDASTKARGARDGTRPASCPRRGRRD